MSDLDDPFREARRRCPIHLAEFQGETLPMLLRHADVKAAAKDWETYSSDAPRRVPIPSEENVRTVRQYPLEVDPPEQTAYRKLVEPFFLRPKSPEMRDRVKALAERLVGEAIEAGEVEAVGEFAIPFQSHALADLLAVDAREAETWIGWGIHVFRTGDGETKGAFMEEYCRGMFERAAEQPGEDFFSALNVVEFEGRPLTMEEKLGFANIAFAGGRDTIIHTATRILDYFGDHPEELLRLREEPERIKLASEEFFRVFIPLTHLGRVCPKATGVHCHPVPAGGRVSLVWSSANRDEEVFDAPGEIRLDRKPNPHLSFGFGPHLCLGAHHARLLIRTLLEVLAERVDRIEVLGREPMIEREGGYERMIGFEKLRLRLFP